MIKLRKIFFYLFLVIYIGFCPFVILYALGMRVNYNTKSIQKTGIISVSTIPAGADVTLNQRHFPKKTPTIIRNLPPGSYPLTLSLKNYLSWGEILTVKEEKATMAENILLIPQKWKSRDLSAESFEELIAITGQPFLLLKKGPLLKDLFIFRWSQGLGQVFFANSSLASDAETIQPIFQKDFIYREGTLRDYYTVKNSPFLLMQVQPRPRGVLRQAQDASKDAEQSRSISLEGLTERAQSLPVGRQGRVEGSFVKYLWIDPRTKPPQVEDITDLFSVEPENVLWDPKEDKIIFSYQKQSIHRLNIKSKAVLPDILDAVRSFSIFGDQLYVLTDDYVFKRVDHDAKNVQILLEDSHLSRSLFADRDKLRITVLAKELILFLDEDGALLFNHLPHRLVDHGVKGFVFNEHKKHLLIWSNHQIGVIDFTKEKENILFEQGPPLGWSITNGHDIQQAFWVNEASQILYRDEDKIFLLEADSLGESLPVEIIGVRPGSAVEYSESLGTLFYLDKKTGYLSSIEILNRGMNVPLPEKIPHAI